MVTSSSTTNTDEGQSWGGLVVTSMTIPSYVSLMEGAIQYTIRYDAIRSRNDMVDPIVRTFAGAIGDDIVFNA